MNMDVPGGRELQSETAHYKYESHMYTPTRTSSVN